MARKNVGNIFNEEQVGTRTYFADRKAVGTRKQLLFSYEIRRFYW